MESLQHSENGQEARHGQTEEVGTRWILQVNRNPRPITPVIREDSYGDLTIKFSLL